MHRNLITSCTAVKYLINLNIHLVVGKARLGVELDYSAPGDSNKQCVTQHACVLLPTSLF